MDDFDFPLLDANILLNQELLDILINAHVIYREELFFTVFYEMKELSMKM